MAIYLTVDGGTTNTRISLVREGRVCDTQKIGAGARNGAEVLKKALRQGIFDLLQRNSCAESEVSRILASGMITSEYGLCNLPHIPIPAGKKELRENLFETVIDEVSTLPFCFIRGVRAMGDALEDADMMRGEETELMGLMGADGAEAAYVLPGSHSKHIAVDGEGRITAFATMLTGELFAAVMEHTILRDAADFDHNTILPEELKKGRDYCRQRGINEALFKTRVLRNVFGATKEACYSFLLGAVLCDEVKAIEQSPKRVVILGGQKQLREAMGLLLADSGKEIRVLDDETVKNSTALGAVRIWESV